jgi:DNA mismatch endonuclease (patch repair protein)
MEFWRDKINGNRKNDRVVMKRLKEQGYRICIFWECVTRDHDLFPQAMEKLREWLPGDDEFLEISI